MNDEMLPLANEKQMGLVGMKVYLRGLAGRIPGFTSFVKGDAGKKLN